MLFEFAFTPDLFDAAQIDGDPRASVILLELLRGIAENGLLANLHKDRFMRHVTESRVPTLAPAIRDKVLTCLNLLDNRHRIVRHPISSAGNPTDDVDWLRLAIAEHERSPLHGIVLSQVLLGGYREGSDAFIEFSGSLDSPKWEERRKRTLNLTKSAADYRTALAPILRHTKSLALIDPWLNSEETRYLDTVTICSNVMGQRGHARLHGRIDIHAELRKQRPDGFVLEDYLNRWEQKLRPLVTADGHRFRIFLWQSLPGSESLHDRYLLTDQCCISAPGGLDCRIHGHANHTVWSLLDEDDRQRISAHYDQAASPFRLEGSRDVI